MFMYLNGLGLGMIFGLVFSYLEGRRITDLLGAGLAVSFIVSSGIIKSVSRWALSFGIDEFWMPFVVGLAFSQR
jgi:NhaP-type Na+/H+ and K+/H+ antiporter